MAVEVLSLILDQYFQVLFHPVPPQSFCISWLPVLTLYYYLLLYDFSQILYYSYLFDFGGDIGLGQLYYKSRTKNIIVIMSCIKEIL